MEQSRIVAGSWQGAELALQPSVDFAVDSLQIAANSNDPLYFRL
jgi:hypothetical protein